MTQMIARFDTATEDIDILIAEAGEEIMKSFSLKEFKKKLMEMFPDRAVSEKPRLLDHRIIAIGSGSMIFREDAAQKIVNYQKKAFLINFPNQLYSVEHSADRIQRIKIYTWYGSLDQETELYALPMPNMTGSDSLCMGTADRSIQSGDVISAVLKIMDAEYTHDHVDNLREKWSTLKWFTFLQNDTVKAEHLKTPVCKLKDLVTT